MFRHSLWLLCVVALCATGLFVVLKFPGYIPFSQETPDRPVKAERIAGSTHYKTMAHRVARTGKADRFAHAPSRNAALPVDPGLRTRLALPKPRIAPGRPRGRTGTQLVAFEASPFPYDGNMPGSGTPFLNFEQAGRRAHKTGSGRIYWADSTYSDRRVLLHVPRDFDPDKPAVMVVFFHGHGATLERDVVARQQVPHQINRSGMNAVLVAPQFAVNARDSSIGAFWRPRHLRRFFSEAARELAKIHGDPASKRAFQNMPVVLVGYSGGYLATAAAVSSPSLRKRLKAVFLLDGLYGKLKTFASWISANRSAVFVSAYTNLTRRRNTALKRILKDTDVAYRTGIGTTLDPGSVAFVHADEKHRNFVTRAWTSQPIGDLLARLTGVAPRRGVVVSALPPSGAAR